MDGKVIMYVSVYVYAYVSVYVSALLLRISNIEIM